MGGGCGLNINSPLLTPLRRIPTAKGDVMHGMKASDPGFSGFGEAYFSKIGFGAIKGWKRHRQMTLNLICISGSIRFVVHDGETDRRNWFSVTLSPNVPNQYQRLTVPPMFWVAFAGIANGDNIVLNVASLLHDPHEAETVDLTHFGWLDETVPAVIAESVR